jgi:hypothetical protein
MRYKAQSFPFGEALYLIAEKKRGLDDFSFLAMRYKAQSFPLGKALSLISHCRKEKRSFPRLHGNLPEAFHNLPRGSLML